MARFFNSKIALMSKSEFEDYEDEDFVNTRKGNRKAKDEDQEEYSKGKKRKKDYGQERAAKRGQYSEDD